MNISPINFVKTNNFSSIKRPLNLKLQSDVFVRSTSFKGNSETQNCTDFVKWAKETDFINSQLENILTNEEYKLGSGFTNTAFQIPNNDNYVLRVRTRSLQHTFAPSNIKKAVIEDSDDKLDINVGQKVAEITIPSKYSREGEYDFAATIVEVLKKQQGEAIGIQPPETLSDDVVVYEAPIRKEKYARTIHKVAQQPVESYEKLISDFQKSCNSGFIFDHLNSNNLLIDDENHSINLIDMEKVSGGIPEANYANLLYSLTNIEYFPTYTSKYTNPVSDEEKNMAMKDTVQIIDKFLKAMKNQGVKFDRKTISYDFHSKFLSSAPCVMYCKAFEKEAFLHKAEIMGLMRN